MKKIISLFQRNYTSDRLVMDAIVPGAEWVAAGEGTATRKYDGTCCLIKDGEMFKRYDARKGKPTPPGFIAAQEPDLITGHYPGWIPIGAGPDDQWHREAFETSYGRPWLDGTYELIGPKVQGNPERMPAHVLTRHGIEEVDAPRTFAALKVWLAGHDIEGVVWHHPDGRMVKIKKKDFGFKR